LKSFNFFIKCGKIRATGSTRAPKFVCFLTKVVFENYLYSNIKTKSQMRKILFFIVAVMAFTFAASAQSRTVTGVVTDEKGTPISGASVLVKGTKFGVTTNSNGVFSISVPAANKTLTVSAVDMQLQDVEITGNVANVSLKSKGGNLQDIVVIGYGKTRKKRDEAGAITTVNAGQLENRPNASLDKALQGQAAGVLVQANNGIPGGAINVRIRGAGSINAGNAPLYIVDGIQLNTRNDAGFTQSNPLAFLNPDDIQSMDIIKDAASAAIYGSNAANGVVIITTKKGRSGKTKFNFNTYFGQTTPLKKLEVTNSQQYYQLRLEATSNFNNLPINSLAAKRAVLTELRVAGSSGFNDTQADSAAAGLKTYDWQDAALRTGTIKVYEIGASGGTEKSTFRLSANLTKQSTILTKADFERIGMRLDLTNKATDKLSFGASINLSTFNQKTPFATDGAFLGNPAFSASGIIPAFPIFNADGSYYGVPGNTDFANLGGTLNQNIIQVNDYNSGFNRTNQLVGSVNTEYKITDWLSFKALVGLDYRLVQGKNVRDARTADGFNFGGNVFVQSNWNANLNTYGTLNFNKNIGAKGKMDALLGYEYRQENNTGITANGQGFPTFQFTSLNNAATPVSIGEFFSGFRRNAVFGDWNYNYDSRYIVGLVGRYDGSSRFGADNRYGLFYGAKAAWNIDQERFLENSKVISALRLRVSYGSTGNDQIGNFDGLGLYGGGGIYNGGPGIAYTQLANPDLRWETTTLGNLGVDIGLFNGRANITAEVYNKQTKDVLLDLPLQSTTGFGAITSNIGRTENRGFELELKGDVIQAKNLGDFNWNMNFNFAINKQKVKELYGGFSVLPGNVSIRVGEPIGVGFTQKYAGVNPSTGRAMWFDTLGNLTYLVQPRDRVVVGPTLLAPYYGGFTNTFSFKNFTLTTLFNYEYGRFTSDGQVNFLRESSGRINFLTDIYQNRWTAPGQLTSVPRMNLGTEAKSSGAGTGTRTFFKADYIRLRNVELAYNLKPETASKLKINNARFYVQGSNLWTYSDWFSYDVEFVGTATGIIPQTKNITVGAQIGF
jgi:TonB-dependent starch-binding outer membrane protein SusC